MCQSVAGFHKHARDFGGKQVAVVVTEYAYSLVDDATIKSRMSLIRRLVYTKSTFSATRLLTCLIYRLRNGRTLLIL